MIKKLLRLVPDSFYNVFQKPAFRYSSYFHRLDGMFSYTQKEQALKTSLEFAKNSGLEGDYLEFGVFHGDNFAAAFHLAQTFRLSSMRFFAFDSFQGLPHPKGVDAQGFQHFREGEFSCDSDRFIRRIASMGVELEKVSVVPGWFDRVLDNALKADLSLQKAAVIYIDCDLYESTVPVLTFITDCVQDGTVLLFDDWFCYRADPKRGEQRAFHEWLEMNPTISVSEFHKFGWHGNSFILHVAESPKSN